MTEVAYLLVAASVALALARVSRIPVIPLLIVAGVVLGRLFQFEQALLIDILLLGVAVLVFTAGVELNPGRVGPQRRLALQIGMVQFLLLALLGAGIGGLLGLSLEGALYMGLALTASSTLVVVRILQKRQQLFEPLGRLIIGVLLLQDLLVILLIPVLSRLPEGTERVLTGLAGTLGLLLAAGVILRWVGPRLLVRLSLDEESLLLVVLSTLFLFLGAAWFLELPLVTGAFFAGLALSGFPIHLLVRGQLNSLGDFFHALFFTALGAFLPVPSGVEVLQSLLLASAVLVLTPPLVAIISERAGLSARPAVAAGLLLAQTSELSLVVALLGVGAGQLPPGILTVVSLITVLTMTATPFLAQDRVQWALLALHPWRQRSDPIHPPQDHILLLGCGRNGLTLLEMLVISPVPVVVVDDDPALVSHLEDDGIQAFRGDISDVRTLERAGLRKARLIISTVRRVQENAPALEMAAGIPMFVRTFNDDEATWVTARGGRPILYSEATAEDFMHWLETGAIPDVADDDL